MVPELLKALRFAAEKHRKQRRKNVDDSPYVNHLIDVAELLAGPGGIEDPITLLAAVLHDTIEDTDTTPDELRVHFGEEVCEVVLEVTDDKSLEKQARKELQVQHAPSLSERAKLLKLADKISNVRDVAMDPPVEWTLERRLEYFEWSEKVVAGLRGCSPNLESLFDEAVAAGRRELAPA